MPETSAARLRPSWEDLAAARWVVDPALRDQVRRPEWETSRQMSVVSKITGRIAFVGAGPGDAGLRTVRAQHLLSCAELLVTDPDVPTDVYARAATDAEV